MSQYIQINRIQQQPILGQIIQIEGELLTIQVKDASSFELGEKISCLYRSFEFDSNVLGLTGNHLYLYFPLQQNKALNDRRRVARVNVNLKATLMLKNSLNKSYDVHNLQMLDASILGFSFITKEPLKVGSICTLLPQSDHLPIKADVKIRHLDQHDETYRYGTEIRHITPNHFHVLRKFVLAQQLVSSASLSTEQDTSNGHDRLVEQQRSDQL